MLDRDLVDLYKTETKTLNLTVRRNINMSFLRLQNETLRWAKGSKRNSQRRCSRKAPSYKEVLGRKINNLQ